MSRKIENGGTAFPVPFPNMGDFGMSIRDYFAGQAIIQLIGLIGIPEDGPDDLWDGSIAERSYAIADAMLKERAK